MSAFDLNFFDDAVIGALNAHARQNWIFDQTVAFVSLNHLLKGGVLMLLLWWIWFRRGDDQSREREHIIATLIGCAVALAMGRILVLTLPFRLRPIHEKALEFTVPYGFSDSVLDGLSSMPSDHAVLFFAFVTGMFFVSRAVGWISLVYTLVVIMLPRMYLGLHYPTDLLAGGAVGAMTCWLANRTLPTTGAVQSILRLSLRWPEFFYPMLFLVTYQIADLFDDTRHIVRGIGKVIERLLM